MCLLFTFFVLTPLLKKLAALKLAQLSLKQLAALKLAQLYLKQLVALKLAQLSLSSELKEELIRSLLPVSSLETSESNR